MPPKNAIFNDIIDSKEEKVGIFESTSLVPFSSFNGRHHFIISMGPFFAVES